jgi:hypothetical protein
MPDSLSTKNILRKKEEEKNEKLFNLLFITDSRAVFFSDFLAVAMNETRKKTSRCEYSGNDKVKIKVLEKENFVVFKLMFVFLIV